MYAITGITGRVGGEAARRLLAAGKPVRAVLRDAGKAQAWADLGCDIAIADMADPEALAAAFTGTTAVFILPPAVYDPAPDFSEVQRVIDSVVAALTAAKPAKVVSLSTIGADATQPNLLSQHTMMEAALRALPLTLTILRPGWFIDNAVWDVASARDTGIIHSFLDPLDKTVPMIAAKDVGQTAAALLQEEWEGQRIVELEGPNLSPNDIAAAFAEVLGKPVKAVIVPRDTWEPLFRSQGMNNPTPRIRMLDGFNESWIAFKATPRKGTTTATEVLAALIA